MTWRNVWAASLICLVSFFNLNLAAQQNCLRHDCSNDPNQIWGDESIKWDENPCTVENCTTFCYQVKVAPGPGFETTMELPQWCGRVDLDEEGNRLPIYPSPRFHPYKSYIHPEFGKEYRYWVRICLNSGCLAWTTDYVSFIGGVYVCFGFENGRRCLQRCYDGEPDHKIPQIPQCD